MTERGFIACDRETGAPSAADVFVAGDLAYGPKLLIHAVASGKTGGARDLRAPDGASDHPSRRRAASRDPRLRARARLRAPARASRSAARSRRANACARMPRPVERGFTRREARREAGRCLDCGVNTIFDGDEVHPLRRLRRRLPGAAACGSSRSTAWSDDPELARCSTASSTALPPAEASAIIKDETICIRCALCAERCPTGAITMERFLFQGGARMPGRLEPEPMPAARFSRPRRNLGGRPWRSFGSIARHDAACRCRRCFPETGNRFRIGPPGRFPARHDARRSRAARCWSCPTSAASRRSPWSARTSAASFRKTDKRLRLSLPRLALRRRGRGRRPARRRARCAGSKSREAIDGRLLVDAEREVEPGTFFKV